MFISVLHAIWTFSVYGLWIMKIGLILDVVWDDLWVILVVFGMISAFGHDSNG